MMLFFQNRHESEIPKRLCSQQSLTPLFSDEYTLGVLTKHDYRIFSSISHSTNKQSNETPHDKTNKMACAPSEDSDQPGHSPSLIRVFDMRSVGS